jgi:hypothetical protein
MLKQDGSNWVIYKTRFLAATGAKGCVLLVLGLKKEPVAPQEPSLPLATADAEAQAAYGAAMAQYATHLEPYLTELQEFTIGQETVRSIILSSVPEILQIKLSSQKLASDMWKELQAKYENAGIISVVDIKARMHRLTTPEGANAEETLDKLVSLKADLTVSGIAQRS